MTKTEAIEVLKGIVEEASESKEAVCYVSADEDIDALDMAIEALEEKYPCGLCKYYEDKEDWGVCQYCPAEPKGSDGE